MNSSRYIQGVPVDPYLLKSALELTALARTCALVNIHQNLRDGVNDGRAAAFLWEWFTTKPCACKLEGFASVVGAQTEIQADCIIATLPSTLLPHRRGLGR